MPDPLRDLKCYLLSMAPIYLTLPIPLPLPQPLLLPLPLHLYLSIWSCQGFHYYLDTKLLCYTGGGCAVLFAEPLP